MVAQVTETPIDTNTTKKTQQPARKRNRKKSKKQKLEELAQEQEERHKLAQKDNDDTLDDVTIEYVVKPVDVSSLKIDSDIADDVLDHFSSIIKHFQEGPKDEDDDVIIAPSEPTDEKENDDAEAADSEDDDKDQPMSKKKAKKVLRISVADLKQKVSKPEVVEWWDANSEDPELLVTLKSYRNTVPIPVHWSQKRKYLQNKRGIEKPPFELPDFIKETGIMEMRDSVREKEDEASMKTKMRQRVQPKMGRLDIDYQKLHDAFFRFQSRPQYSIHGEMYYEGKETEVRVQEKNPGQLSEDLKEALNMPPLAPPPWLINMQRYGPPPNYPTLRIPGLNAPIPEGAQWGYHPGGWGRPPVDEMNRPLYGDVFGVTEENQKQTDFPVMHVDKTLFGELEADEDVEESEEESEDEQVEEMDQEEQKEEQEEPVDDGTVTPSGMTSVSTIASGLETPDVVELRKERRTVPMSADEPPKQLYQVLQETDKSVSGLMGSQHGYELANVEKPVIAPTTGRIFKRKHDEVDVAFDPSELEAGLDESTLRAKYNQQVSSKVPGANGEDLSDMVAEHANRQTKKKKQERTRKEKEFKF
ncbi:DUF382-domain-containing protein [Hesseltinella vesiculosa]|uniref:DUF382-domain-containing protein n=1 Tax=Hesseltinella vesiculosa TaxID=101127 RepID=A0A1X2GTP4_9FUNG|nr:DUF382-domain-containing protein [Hesseltinella vesiculosa]